MMLRLFRRKHPPSRASLPVWIARHDNGKFWAGPYKYQGRTMTRHLPLIYKWGTEQSCRSSIMWSGLSNVHPVKVDWVKFADGHRKAHPPLRHR